VADKLMIVLVNADPSNPAEVGPPLFQATVAAAMEYEVEIIITGRSGELARRGVAEQLQVPDASQTVYALMQEAHRAGVVFKLCAPALGLEGDDLIQEISETVGGAYLISEAMDDATVTLTF
jgi:predicted peroxiredoxin